MFKTIVRALLIIGIAITAYHGAAVYLYGESYLTQFLPKPAPKEETLSGTIVISGIKTGEESIETQLIQTYGIDAVSGGLWKRIGDPERGVIMTAFYEPVSPMKPLSFFLRAMLLTNNVLEERVFSVDVPTKRIEMFPINIDQDPQLFAFSEKYGLAYQIRNETATSTDASVTPDIGSFSIRVFSLSEKRDVVEIEGAVQPHWSPEGTRLIYLKPNGMFYYDLATQIESLLIPIRDFDEAKGNFVSANTKIAVSASGRYIVWSSPTTHTVSMFTVDSWDNPHVNLVHRVETATAEYYWPIFSPGERFYAVQAIDTPETPEVHSNPRLEIRLVNDGSLISTHSLAEFDFNRLFSDAWVPAPLAEFDADRLFTEGWIVREFMDIEEGE